MRNEKEQTGVDWLVEQLLNGKALMPSTIEKAKEMEKEQIKDAYYNGTTDEIKTKEELLFEAEHFYNETYRGNK